MSKDLTPEAFDELFESQYDYTRYPNDEERGDFFEDELKLRPDLVQLRNHIFEKLNSAPYFNWRGGDEIDSFVEGFTAAVILLSAYPEQPQ